jgi:hypothetical protein
MGGGIGKQSLHSIVLNISSLDGQQFTVEVEDNATVISLKNAIQKSTGFPSLRQILVCDGSNNLPMNSAHCIQTDYGITHGSSVLLALCDLPKLYTVESPTFKGVSLRDGPSKLARTVGAYPNGSVVAGYVTVDNWVQVKPAHGSEPAFWMTVTGNLDEQILQLSTEEKAMELQVKDSKIPRKTALQIIKRSKKDSRSLPQCLYQVQHVSGDGLPVYSEPNTDSKVLFTLPNCVHVTGLQPPYCYETELSQSIDPQQWLKLKNTFSVYSEWWVKLKDVSDRHIVLRSLG